MSDIRPLPIDLRNHLTELTGNELKVWLAYYLHTNFELTSYPSNQTIAAETGVSHDTVKSCKASLRLKGWLDYTGDFKQPRRAGGEFGIPVMEVSLPWREDWATVVTDLCMTYDAITVVEKTTHGTVVENFHPEGSSSCSGFGSGSGSSSLSPSSTRTLSDSNKGSRPKSVRKSKEKIKDKSKPENLEPEPKPRPAPSMPKPKGHAQDGTPYPPQFDDWSNLNRLQWLEAHGRHQGSMAETVWEKTDETEVMQAKPTPTATPIAHSPRSAPPPILVVSPCAYCGGPAPCEDELCDAYEPSARLNPASPRVPNRNVSMDNDGFDV
jgi:hypothetical protein